MIYGQRLKVCGFMKKIIQWFEIVENEKNSLGPTDGQISPLATQIGPSAQTVFLFMRLLESDVCFEPTHLPEEQYFYGH